MPADRDRYIPGVPCWVDTAQPDPEAAVAFHGGLFGWEFEDRMPADAPGSYFVAPLRGRDVAAVGSQQEGVPPTQAWSSYVWVDSADDAATAATAAGGRVVASMVLMTHDRFPEDALAHWGVTFAVEDADATAERATELEGKVLTAPFDAPWVRAVVLGDPRGAVFTASKFVPPE